MTQTSDFHIKKAIHGKNSLETLPGSAFAHSILNTEYKNKKKHKQTNKQTTYQSIKQTKEKKKLWT